MSCKINYTKDGKIESVLALNGEESSLYNKFAKMPFNTKESALEAYKQTLTNPSEVESNPKFNGYDTYKEALQNSFGEDIKVTVDDVVIQTVSSNINPNTELGLVNNAIKTNILSDEKMLQDGDSFYKAEGKEELVQIVNEQVFKDFANENSTSVKLNRDGRITLNKLDESKQYRDKSFSEVKEELGEERAIITLGYSDIIDSLFRGTKKKRILTNGMLVQKTTAMLNNAGFKIVSLQEYKADYAKKNGIEPNAEALIDLSNKVVAFADGVITPEVMTEEFVHLVLESIPQEGLQDVLRNVVSTEEYAEYSEMYREAYARDGQLTEEEVEQKVRKEILGKIVAKGIQQEISPKSQNIFNYIINLIRDFFAGIKVDTAFRNEVKKLTESVIDMIITEDALALNSERRDLTFYSLNQNPSTANINTLNEQLKVLLSTVRDQEKTFRKSRFSNSKSIEKTLQDITLVESKVSILSAVDFINKQVNFVEKAIQQSKSQGVGLSPEQLALASNLKTNINDLLVKIGNTIKGDSHLNTLNSDIDSIKLRIVNLNTEPDAEVLRSIVKKAMTVRNLPTEFSMNGVQVNTEEYFLKAITQVSRDTNLIYSYIGQVSHAKDPLMNLLDSVVFNMVQNQNKRFVDKAKTFQNRLEELGVSPKDLEQFIDKGGYITSIFDFDKYNSEVLRLSANHFFNFYTAQKTSLGEDIELTLEEITEKLKKGEQFKESDRLKEAFRNEYSKVLSNDIGKLRERVYTDKYYEEQKSKLEDLEIPQEAIDKINQLSFDRADIMSRVETVDGYPVLRAQEKIDLDAYNTERNTAKGLYDDDGNLKSGIILISEAQFKKAYPNDFDENKHIYPDLGIVRSGSNYITLGASPSVEAKIAYGITKSDANFIETTLGNVKETELPKAFLEMLKKIPTNQGKVDFFLANVNLSVDDSFYTPTVDDFAPYLGQNIKGFKEAYDELISYQNSRRELLKRYKDSKNASNTLASKMPSSVQDRIKELSKAIGDKRKEMFLLIGVKASEFQLDPTVESDINEDYKNQLRDLGIEKNKLERLAFAKKHMSSDATFNLVESSLEMLKLGTDLTPFMENILGKALGNISISVSDVQSEINAIANSNKSKFDKDVEVRELISGYLVDMAEKRLAPYYKAITPKGVSDLMTQLQTTTNINQTISDLNKAGVNMRVNQSYYETLAPNPDLNVNYKKGFLGFKAQPKLSMFFNNEFEKKLNVTVKRVNGEPVFDEYGIPEVVSSNPLFEAYKEVIKLKTEINSNTDSLVSDNLFLAPQVSKTTLDKTFSILKSGKSAKPIMKEFINEMTTFRVDEQAQGETTQDGDSLFSKTGLRVIPKKYFHRLETPEDVSSDLFYSSMMMLKESELHKARKEALTEVTALENAIKSKKYSNGKDAVATNTYKMAKSYIDYNLYGIAETTNFRTTLPIIGTVDVAKVAKMFHGFVRFKNLAYNAIIPITSWLTAEVNILLEQWIGQYLDKDSIGQARKLTAKLFTESAREFLSVKTKGRLNLIGEYLGVYELEANFKDANLGKGAILLGKASMGAHSMANFTPVSQAMLAGVVGRRVYGGEFLDKKQFEASYKLNNPNAKQSEINAEWVKLRDKSFYNYMITENNKLELDYKKMATDLGENDTQEFRDKMDANANLISGSIRKFIERIDGNIPQHEKTMLQRNYLGSFLFTHKGWFSIALTNRFKSTHYNMQTNQVEEGSYTTFMHRSNAVWDEFKQAMKDKKPLKDYLKIAKDTFYSNASEYQKDNIKRVGKDLALSTTLYVMAMMLNGLADDDDNKDNYLAQVSAILTNRVFNETKSSQLGLLNEIVQTVQDPVVGFDQMGKSLQFWNAFNPTETTAKKFSGSSKAFEYWFTNLPMLKNAYQLRDADALNQYRNSYLHFNDVDSYNIASLIVDSKEFKEMLGGN